MNEQATPPTERAAADGSALPRWTGRGAVVAAVVGALALVGVAWTFRAGPWVALAMTLLMGGFYAWGLLELRRYAAASAGLADALDALRTEGVDFPAWLAALPAAVQPVVRRRAEGERAGAAAPPLAPYITGLLVLLGMLGTFLGMVLTFTGTSQVLQTSADVQALRSALAGPVQGLGLAFGTSVGGVAASAMLGLVSALVRRRRAEVLQALDRALAGPLRPHTREHRQQALQAAMEAQAALLPTVAQQLQQLMGQLAEQQQAWQAHSLASQQQFHDHAGRTLGDLARSVESSLKTSLEAGAREGAALLKPAVEQALEGLSRASTDWQARVGAQAEAHLQQLHQRFEHTASAVAAQWQSAAQAQQQGAQDTVVALGTAARQTVAALEQASTGLLQSVQGSARETVAALQGAAEQTSQSLQRTADASLQSLQRNAHAVVDALQSTAQGVVQSLQATAEHTLQSLQRTGVETVQSVQGATTAAVQSVEASAHRSADALALAAQTTSAALAASTEQAAVQLNERAIAVMDGLGTASSRLTTGVEERLHHWLGALATQQAEQQRTMAEAAAALSEQAGRLQGELGREVSVQLRGLAEGVAGQLDALAGGVGRQLEAVADRFAATAERLSHDGQVAQQQWAEQAQQQTAEQRAALAAFSDRFGAQAIGLIGEVGATQTRWLDAAAEREQARFVAWTQALQGLGEDLRQRWADAGAQAQRQQQQIADALAETATRMAADNEAQARRMVDDIAALMAAAAEAPRAAAQVIDGLRAQWAASAERDQTLLEERGEAVETLRSLMATAEAAAAQQQQAVQGLVAAAASMLDQVGERFASRVENTAAGLGDAAVQVAAGSVEVASVADVFAGAVDRFGDSSAQLIAQLQRVEQAMVQAQARSDDQMAYVVAQAREVVDLTVMQQKQLLDEWQRSTAALPRGALDG